MKDELLITEDNIYQVPLLIPIANGYFEKAGKKENELYYRACDLRLCLEKICDQYIFEFIDDPDKIKWNQKGMTLGKKLDICKKYLDSNVTAALKDAKNIGNKGVHAGTEATINEADLEKSQQAIFDFSLEVLVFYFKKYGYAKMNDEGFWVPYVFSTLPPLYRVKVLEKYYKSNPEPIVIEKLAMAYTKSRLNNELKEFLNMCLNQGNIDQFQYDCILDEMKCLEAKLDTFPIAKNMKEAKENFIVAWNIVEKDPDFKGEPFILLMSLIFYGSKEGILTEKEKIKDITTDFGGVIVGGLNSLL